jgi:hypothetical protein
VSTGTHYSDTIGAELVGRSITGLWVNHDDTLLVFETPEGFVGYAVEGDCCSTSWFNDIDGVSVLLGHTVAKVEGIPMSDGFETHDERNNDDSVQLYGTRITTDHGTCDVVFRNASNGYYGGWADYVFVGTTQGLTPIVRDWTSH